MTLKAGCPSPLMAAARATAFRQKRVPHRSASFERRFWTSHPVTTPSARRCRTPTAQRTSDPAERLALLSGHLPIAEAIVLEKLNGHLPVHIVSERLSIGLQDAVENSGRYWASPCNAPAFCESITSTMNTSPGTFHSDVMPSLCA